MGKRYPDPYQVPSNSRSDPDHLEFADFGLESMFTISIGITIRGFHFYTGVDIENNPQSTLKLVMDPDPSLIDIQIHNSTPSPLTAMRIKIAFA